MKSFKLALVYSLGVWAIPFVAAMFIFPLRNNDRAFFESIMPVVLTLATVIFAILYLRKVEFGFIKEGILLGIVFMIVSLVIDYPMFIRGPLAMPYINYIKDIGFTYLIIPIITTSLGYVIEKRNRLKI